MDARAALKDLAAWRAADDEDRVTVLVALATRLGAGWRAGRTAVGRLGLGELLRRDLGLAFVVVPGGWLRMGHSADDLFTAAKARAQIAPRAVWGNAVTAARPTRWVRMRPYLLAIAGLAPAGDQARTDGDEPAMRTVALDELAAAVPEGFRLPSEAELEWALRDGGATRWIGVPGDVEVTAENRDRALLGPSASGMELVGLRRQNPCGDGAVDYDVESPIDQRARSTDRGAWVARGAPAAWKDGDEELIAALAGHRAAATRTGATIVRLAVDLPGLTRGDDGGDGDDAAVVAEAAADTAAAADADLDATGDGDEDARPDAPNDAAKGKEKEKEKAAAARTDRPTDDDAPPGELAEHALVLGALTGSDPRRQLDAVAALAHLAIGPASDVAPTVTAVLQALPGIAAAARVHVLGWIADVQVGSHLKLAAERPERRRRHELPEDRAAVRAAVAAAADHLVLSLDDHEPGVRAAAALALAFTVDAPAEAKAALARRLGSERELGVQATLILALVRLGAGFRAPAPDPVIAGAIAIATAFDGPPNIDALVAAAAIDHVPHLAFGGGRLGHVAVGIIRKQDAATQAEAAPELATHALAAGSAELALIACELAFGAPAKATPPRRLEELTSSQRRVVSRLADLDRPLDWLGFGLPPTVAARRRFLAIDADGPTDRFVTHGDSEVPLWFALRAREASEGLAAAQAEAARLLARLPIGERLAVYLDRGAHQLGELFEQITLDQLLAAAARELEAAREALDEMLRAPAVGPRGPELVRAVAATRRPGEDLAETLLAEIDGGALGQDLDALRGFTPAAIARHLNRTLQPILDRALASDEWQAGLDADLSRWARVLAIAPSPSATRRLLLLGWASGAPAAVRAAVGASATSHATLEPILREYDSLPTFTSWATARSALSGYAS